MNIKLLSNRVLIDAGDLESKTPSGVIVAKKFEQGEMNMGTVVAVGYGKDDGDHGFLGMTVKVGDKVIFQYGSKVQIEGKTYITGTEDDIIMILNPSK
jgi:co-chaperonin GroES (HSP10)